MGCRTWWGGQRAPGAGERLSCWDTAPGGLADVIAESCSSENAIFRATEGSIQVNSKLTALGQAGQAPASCGFNVQHCDGN